jgi:hypothetical protein
LTYSLLLISEAKPTDPDGITVPMQMFAWGLWEEFSRMEHVSLAYHGAESRELPKRVFDFVLVIHSDRHVWLFDDSAVLHAVAGRKIIWAMEVPAARWVDYNFTWLPLPSGYTGEQVPLPCPHEMLRNSMVGVRKLPGGILLDHSYANPAGTFAEQDRSNRLWQARLVEWLTPLCGTRRFAQLQRRDCGGDTPDWIDRVPWCGYPEYLRLTAPYENFIMTHPGSYEHSVIDMAARGIKVLVPTENGVPFTPIAGALGLRTFSTREELLSLLDYPDHTDRASLCTDMSEVAARIDRYCRSCM